MDLFGPLFRRLSYVVHCVGCFGAMIRQSIIVEHVSLATSHIMWSGSKMWEGAMNLCYSLLFGRDIRQQYFIFSQYLPILCFLSFSCQETFSVTPQPSEGNIRNISKSFSWMLPKSDYFSLLFCKRGRDRIQIPPIVHMCVPGILQLGAPLGSQPTWSLGQLKPLLQKQACNSQKFCSL